MEKFFAVKHLENLIKNEVELEVFAFKIIKIWLNLKIAILKKLMIFLLKFNNT